MALGKPELEYVIRHVFLPTKLPDCTDHKAANDFALLHMVAAALKAYQQYLPVTQTLGEVSTCARLVDKMLELRTEEGDLNNLEDRLQGMIVDDVIAFELKAQNAGLVIRRMEDRVSFESFELSPTNTETMATKGRLIRCFPGPAIGIPSELMTDAHFREPLVKLLASLDHTTCSEAKPLSAKAGSKYAEIRDTRHPMLVTEMLTGMLRGLGEALNVTRIYKHTRDEVMWKGTLVPWRRSPLWLLVRVALQTTLVKDNNNHAQYKSFMIFFMARLLEKALLAEMSHEAMFVMAAKISRRRLKLKMVGESDAGMHYVTQIVKQVHAVLVKKWDERQLDSDPLGLVRPWKSAQLSFLPDTVLSIRNLGPYMETIPKRPALARNATKHNPHHVVRVDQNSFALPVITQDDMCLLDTEAWVAKHIRNWADRNQSFGKSCKEVSEFMNQYRQAAISKYSGNPVDMSVMFLTLLDLLVALDICALNVCPLLKKYKPIFVKSLFEPLLLRRKGEMERLFQIEKYFNDRKNAADFSSSLLFEDTKYHDSFAVKYFDQSQSHQTLRRTIEAAATVERNRKKLELVATKARHRKLMNQYNSASCENNEKTWDYDEEEWIASHVEFNCSRCQLKRDAASIQIDVHEWPLPNNDLEAKVAVFECNVPEPVVQWRDTTYSLLTDVFSPNNPLRGSNDSNTWFLKTFSGLRGYVTGPVGRMQLASNLKPVVVSHYNTMKITDATDNNICVNNGMSYDLYDSNAHTWTSAMLGRGNIRKDCTFKLPPGSYDKLQWALDDTAHTSNEVLSKQRDCPRELDQHQFHAFGILRSGSRLQWRNIARELAARVLNFNHYETCLLVMQAMFQVGLAQQSIYRDSHLDLEEKDFGLSLIATLEHVLNAVEGNWQNAIAVRVIVAVASHLLSMSPWEEVRHRCLAFLVRSRKVTLEWSREVGQLAHESQNERETKEMSLRAFELALLCCSTFDVEQEYMLQLLSVSDGVEAVAESCINVCDRCPASEKGLSSMLLIMLRQHEKLTHRLEHGMRCTILHDNAGLHNTVKRVWGGYRAGTAWEVLSKPNDRWLVSHTSGQEGFTSKMINYNLLTGALLVGGVPLTRLPNAYDSHSTYAQLFGEKVLNVVPSTMASMVFETRADICKQQVHFRLHDKKLIVRTRTSQGGILEFLPRSKMAKDFPKVFVDDFVHWLDIKTNIVEWRPVQHPWASSSATWCMKPMGNGKFHLSAHENKARLIDIRSPTAKAISQLLSPIETLTNIHIIYNQVFGNLEISLPRMKLDFTMKGSQTSFMSKQFRGMEVDSNQSFGSLTGLASKLVLKHTTNNSRRVIVPAGKISYVLQDHHVRVAIDTESGDKVKYYVYQIDDQLGRLLDNDLQSRLYRLYLHATTSNCLVDKLTGKTGTESALEGLREGLTKSFVSLEAQDIEILRNIATLSPGREYYPSHLKVMQTVDWDVKLPTLSQHDSFFNEAKAILDQATAGCVFQENPQPIVPLKAQAEEFLVQRATIRNSSFRVEGFGAEGFNIRGDRLYASRDNIPKNDIREARTAGVSKLVNSWPITQLKVCQDLLKEIESWSSVISGPAERTGHRSLLGFNVGFLDSYQTTLCQNWCLLHKKLSESKQLENKYEILIMLSTMGYSSKCKLEHIETLLALATAPGLRQVLPPNYQEFDLGAGYSPTHATLISLVNRENCLRGYDHSSESKLPKLANEKNTAADKRRRRLYEIEKKKSLEVFATTLERQWPIASPSRTNDSAVNKYIDTLAATNTVQKHFQSWYRNRLFAQYIETTQAVLDRLVGNRAAMPRYAIYKESYRASTAAEAHVRLLDLFSARVPVISTVPPKDFSEWVTCADKIAGQTDRRKLEGLLQKIESQSSNAHERQYAKDLESSFKALPSDSGLGLKRPRDLHSQLDFYVQYACSREQHLFDAIRNSLECSTNEIARESTMLPRVTRLTILSQLAGTRVQQLPRAWKTCLLEYGLTISQLQRAERLRAAAKNDLDLLSEIQNPGHQGWKPEEHPEWLLLELENNILIREEQAQISQEMMSPSIGSNCVMQLNMGLGKSSVIVPIVAAALADGSKLVRVVVLKPLAMQMFQLLAHKVGRLLNRRVVYMPVSRSLDLTAIQACQVRLMYQECQRAGSILLLQPEHILSFELMGLDRFLTGDIQTGKVLMDTQKWLYQNSRDLLDESDEILNVRFELIYTIGEQQEIELSPERWTIIQNVLGMLSTVAEDVLKIYPRGVEVVQTKPGRFPRIRILQAPAAELMMNAVAVHLCKYGVAGAQVRNLDAKVKQGLYDFFRTPDKALPGFVDLPTATKSCLLLLKGLVGCGVLTFAFGQKRWRVNYGLDESRSMLAVPFHAKDVAATRAEFSHPDTTIVLTCLSYYYGGLSEQQVRLCFEKLLQTDSPQQEYDRWVASAPELAEQYRTILGINLSNDGQCRQEVFPPLKFSKAIVDFYLSVVVFPAEMREFPHKLSSSGWDIARDKTPGNPRRALVVPTTLSTNALVLDNLLRSENCFEDISSHSSTGTLNAEVLLEVIRFLQPPVRVIIDVGAQVLELRNEEMAQAWLSRIPESDAQAAIFLDAKNDICVLTRDGRVEPLRISPFATQMDQCVVYLDESHTRGTDLKLPDNYRAICTLGPHLTKDRLVQACMRMRKLGKGQSVVFCSSMEIQLQIAELSGASSRPISVADVLHWSVRQSCIATHKSIPLWATQGARHQYRRAIDSRPTMTTAIAEALREPEAQTLIQRYGPPDPTKDSLIFRGIDLERAKSRESELSRIRAKCKEFEIESFSSATLQEEQERELSPENEREQQIELPPAATPLKHSVHPDVRKLADGILVRNYSAFQPAWDIFKKTSASKSCREAWPTTLLVTADFARTVKSGTSVLDAFLRPVHWVISVMSCPLWGGKAELELVIISPFEAQDLMPSIREKGAVRLHTYSPRLSLATQGIENLAFCAIPAVPADWSSPSIGMQLNLFAGSLYFQTCAEYQALCDFLGISRASEDTNVEQDGFVKPHNRTGSSAENLRDCKFQISPVGFVKELVALRRKGQSAAVSHMGRILEGEMLRADEVEKRGVCRRAC